MSHPFKVAVTVCLLTAGSMLLPENGWIGPLLAQDDLFGVSGSQRVSGEAVTAAANGLSKDQLSRATRISFVEPDKKQDDCHGGDCRSIPLETPIKTGVTALVSKPKANPFQGHPLGRLYTRIQQVEAGKGPPVHIVQLGDSEIASDAVTMTTRRLASERFGDGGPGFVLAMRPWPSYSRSGIWHPTPDQFAVKSFPRKQSRDGHYGPGGIGFEPAGATTAGISLKSDIRGKPCRVGFYYLQQPKGGAFRLTGDGKVFLQGETEGPRRTARADHRFKACPKFLTFYWSGYGRFRAYGWQIHADAPGMSWTSIGVNGARLTHLNHYRDTSLANDLKLLEPDALLLTFGLNVTAYPIGPNPRYADGVDSALAAIRSGLPDVPCLVLGPYPVATKIKGNWELSPTVAKVIAAQAKAARKNGCAFIDRFQELGGREALKAWRGKRPRLLSGDNVHLTREGSKRMGEFVFALLTGEYDRLQGRAPVN